MNAKQLARPPGQFRAGESVIVLYQGKYNGRLGRFVGSRPDPNWVDIEESPGVIRAHPLDWVRRIDNRFDRMEMGPTLTPLTGEPVGTAQSG